MKPITALLRRYSTTLFLVCIAILATVAVAQTVRLRYLEDRHQQLVHDFGKSHLQLQLQTQAKLGELAARCATPPAS